VLGRAQDLLLCYLGRACDSWAQKRAPGVFWLVASVFLPLGGHDWHDLDTTGLPCSLLHGGSRIAFASINTAATMRATTLVLLVAGAAALQPTLRVHAAARPVRTSGDPVQKTTQGIDDLLAKRC